MTWRASTSSWNSAPSIATWRMRGLSTAIRFSACTTSGQLWQVSDMYVSNAKSPSSAWICSMTSGSSFGGWPPACSSASTSDVNSWPIGIAANRTPMSWPARLIENDGRLASVPSCRTRSSGLSIAISSSSSRISPEAARSSSEATMSTGCVRRCR